MAFCIPDLFDVMFKIHAKILFLTMLNIQDYSSNKDGFVKMQKYSSFKLVLKYNVQDILLTVFKNFYNLNEIIYNYLLNSKFIRKLF
jgi:hypothetical protein